MTFKSHFYRNLDPSICTKHAVCPHFNNQAACLRMWQCCEYRRLLQFQDFRKKHGFGFQDAPPELRYA